MAGRHALDGLPCTEEAAHHVGQPLTDQLLIGIVLGARHAIGHHRGQVAAGGGDHPHIDLDDLVAAQRLYLARMQRPQQDALLARGLGRSRLGLYAHRNYLARHGTPNTLEALAVHRLIGYDRQLGRHAHWQEQGFPLSIEDLAFRSDCAMARLAALRAGLGIGLCHASLAARESDLVALAPELFGFELEMWLAMHEDQRQRAGLRRLFDFLAEQLPQRMQLASFSRG